MHEKTWAVAHPSLALTKYWGKSDTIRNLPATPSLALTLSGLTSEVSVQAADKDQIILDQQIQPPERYARFFAQARRQLGLNCGFSVQARNNFPTAAGLASSSSGFAALAAALCAMSDSSFSTHAVSRLARLGSGSASRAVYGGFSLLPAGGKSARLLYDREYWPDLRVLICLTDPGPKSISSRTAMEISRATSPYYSAWLRDARSLTRDARSALREKNLEKLGSIIRQSYLRMFSVLFSSHPPILLWNPLSLALIRYAEEQRSKGISVWETMDAGPQVKYFCQEQDLDKIKSGLSQRFPHLRVLTAGPGQGVLSGSGEFPA